MGYQEYLVTARDEKDFRELIRLCAEARGAGFYDGAAPLKPLSVAFFKEDVGLIPAGTTALWAAGERTGDPGAGLLPQGAPMPPVRVLPADNAEALGMDGKYICGIDFSAKTDKSENEYLTRYSLRAYCAEFCTPQTAFADTAFGREFMRRLNAESFRFALDEKGAGMIYAGRGESVRVDASRDIFYKPEHRALAQRIRVIRDEVDEYMTAFAAAPPRFPGDEKSVAQTRTLLMFGNTEFAARRSSRYGVDFVTWRLDRNGEREIGHYFGDYAAAKEDFVMRCGLIDRRKLFTETELRLIRSGLAEIADITPDRGFAEMTAIRALVEKIDDVVIPEISEQEQRAEDQCYEPEIDL
ncbi:MAG: hypothetical protein LBK56_07070 [Gracilibacteraceae bacterium]|jgi:hypothetical protein|nr:hypothetical protein [Gracilibacteraceae bacterium]